MICEVLYHASAPDNANEYCPFSRRWLLHQDISISGLAAATGQILSVGFNYKSSRSDRSGLELYGVWQWAGPLVHMKFPPCAIRVVFNTDRGVK